MKKNRIIGVFLVAIIIIISAKLFIKYNERFGGAVISGSIGGFNLNTTEGFSKYDEEYILNMCLSKRKGGIEVNSQKANSLGKPTNMIGLHIYNKLDFVSSRGYDYYVWLGEDKGYIRNVEENEIYTLSSDEKKFLIDCYLKYHSYEEVETMISKEY